MTDTITLPREELQAALDALDEAANLSSWEGFQRAASKLRARLAQQEEKILQEVSTESLGYEAAKVLHENLWDLYARSEAKQEEKPEPVAFLVEGMDGATLVSHQLYFTVDEAKKLAKVFAEHYPTVHTKPLYTAPVAVSDISYERVAENKKLRHEEKPEPVADGIQVIEHVRNVQYKIKSRYHLENGTELYTAPPQREWQGLTDEEIWNADEIMAANSECGASFETLRELVHAISDKLKEKNT